MLRELDVIREFMTGAGLISFCDAPWVPIFVAVCFVMHPWYGWIALSGAILIFSFAVANELLTREQLKTASRNSNVAGAFAAATFRNVEVLHAMGMWRPFATVGYAGQNDTLALQDCERSSRVCSALRSFYARSYKLRYLGMVYDRILGTLRLRARIAASIIMGRALAPVEIIVSQWENISGGALGL